jgi:hypothetical protein
MIVQVYEFDEVSAPGTNEPWNLVVMRVLEIKNDEDRRLQDAPSDGDALAWSNLVKLVYGGDQDIHRPPAASTKKRTRRRCRRARSGRAIRGQLALTALRAPNQ